MIIKFVDETFSWDNVAHIFIGMFINEENGMLLTWGVT